MSKTPALALVIVLILVIGVGAFIFKNSSLGNPNATQEATLTPSSTTESSNSPAASSATTQIMEVSYTDSGFSPTTLTIKQGDTVKFTNNSSKPMWVASDPHPTHTDYSAFDNRKGIGKGESYEFTFDTAGTHEYHNHLSAKDGGTIIVQ